nr:hypothetical protein [Acidobacteriota bacterium]
MTEWNPRRPLGSPERLLRAVLLTLALWASYAPRPAHAGVERWTPLGPEGGGFNHLSFDPSDAKTLYLSGGGHGLWKSIDGGDTWWQPATGTTEDVLVDPFDPRTLYRVQSETIDQSSDSGASWSRLLRAPNFVGSLAADPHAAGTVYATAFFNGVYRTRDGGATWQRVNTGLPTPLLCLEVAVDPGQAQSVYLATDRGLWKSSDAGDHWTFTDVLSVNPALLTPELLSIAAAPAAPAAGPSTLYTQAAQPVSGSCLFRSADRGTSWTYLPRPALPPLAKGNEDFCGRYAVDPEDPARLYTVERDGNLYRTHNGAGSWELASPGLLPGALSRVWVNPHSGALLYGLSSAGEILRSTDFGSSWQPGQQGFDATRIAFLRAASGDPATLYAGEAGIVSQAGGPVWKSADRGQSWSAIASGILDLAIDPAEPGHLLAVAPPPPGLASWITESHDGGATWTRLPGGPSFLVRIFFHPALRGTLYAASEDAGDYVSGDAGATWRLLGVGALAGCPLSAPCFQSTAAFAFHPADPHIFYTVFAGGVWKTTDGGVNWTRGGSGPDLAGPLVLDPTAPQTLYAGACDGVWKSTDGAVTWTLSSRNLPVPQGDVCVGALTLDPRHSGTLYAGLTSLSGLGLVPGSPVQAGVFRTTDAGATWSRLAPGLDGTAISDLLPDPGDPGRIYAATRGNGVVAGRFVGAHPLTLGTPLLAAPPPRFSVTAAWQDFAGASGPATPVQLTAESGYFWFFEPGNLELAAKI